MDGLYPLKFKAICKDKIWGGDKLKDLFNKEYSELPNCGESWELSGVEGNVSEVTNGYLAGNNLQELAEIYMGELVGEKVYEKFGVEFPLLIKFIDANDDLSIQVHPDDKMSKERHNAYGKTEMWYVLQADKGAKLVSGFNQEVDQKKYLKHLEDNTLTDILNVEEVKEGDVFFMPAGRVHAIGSGLVIAEIQQTSDVTYRIYDYNRKDDQGNTRELHTDWALDAIDYTLEEKYKTEYEAEDNKSSLLAECEYFTTNLLNLSTSVEKDYNDLDSFVIYLCLDGEYVLSYGKDQAITVAKGETILVPASIENYTIVPKKGQAKLLEVYIK
ncbi:mannose-6-phosphate isomerase [Puteibacter caeruleilacunae]|nr:mannose-6-phosphate isomerase [Puteibacter caeruleilacunae]